MRLRFMGGISYSPAQGLSTPLTMPVFFNSVPEGRVEVQEMLAEKIQGVQATARLDLFKRGEQIKRPLWADYSRVLQSVPRLPHDSKEPRQISFF